MNSPSIIISTKRPLVIYHSNCADGFGAAWCFQDHADNYEFHAGIYNKEPPDCTGRTVYLVDFSYKKDVVKAICAVASYVYFLDHHVTAINDLLPLSDPKSEDWQKNFYAVTSLEKSGAMIAWDFLHNGMGYDFEVKKNSPLYYDPPLLLDHIQDRDLWKFKLPMTRTVSAGLFSFEYSFDQWNILMLGGAAELVKLSAAGAAIERKHWKDVKSLIEMNKRFMSIGIATVPVVNCPGFMSSDVAGTMAAEYKDGTVFAATYSDTDEERIFSLRSAPNGRDVSAIAATYGGGGHKNAAGFKVPRTHLLATK